MKKIILLLLILVCNVANATFDEYFQEDILAEIPEVSVLDLFIEEKPIMEIRDMIDWDLLILPEFQPLEPMFPAALLEQPKKEIVTIISTNTGEQVISLGKYKITWGNWHLCTIVIGLFLGFLLGIGLIFTVKHNL